MDGEKFTQQLHHYGQLLWQPLATFWQWWSRQLFSLLPASISHRLLGQKQRLCIYTGQEHYRLELTPHGEQLLLDDQAEQSGLLADMLRQADSIRLCLNSKDVLYTHVTLPAATAGNLADVLRFEMDRHTPFSADQVYFGYRLAERDKQQLLIRVELLLAPRAQVDSQLAELNLLGLVPTALANAEHPQAPLIPLQAPTSIAVSKARRLKTLQGALVLFMLFLLIAVPLYHRQNRIESLSTQLDIPRQRAEQTAELKRQLEELQQSRQFLARERARQPSALLLLDALTRQLPDHTWLSRFELRDGTVQLRGESANASELIGILEASPLFFDVRFSSPVTNNPATSKDRFMIDARFGEEDS
ncbi:PilN domain-containing protein [Oceanisphaera arctica]|uniref:General secretion pathway protein GspL n=1 Tax=Oceanisphaera arctica TaxID=641510 RepID=A0A2P5TPF9_9GAMM|nr:PilN domain-containing protein [Oceanisphaera arctica]PPL17529.1 general secretion pathway protein GspL [Oceanisphaera arctica]GHA16503.1 type II secretion system protein L [Oceanisphaera arctica]